MDYFGPYFSLRTLFPQEEKRRDNRHIDFIVGLRLVHFVAEDAAWKVFIAGLIGLHKFKTA